MSMMITGRENILRFQALSRLYALRVQRDTGLRHSRGSVAAVCRRDYGIKSRSIAGVIAELEQLFETGVSFSDLVAESAGKRGLARADESIQPGGLQDPRHQDEP